MQKECNVQMMTFGLYFVKLHFLDKQMTHGSNWQARIARKIQQKHNNVLNDINVGIKIQNVSEVLCFMM